MLNSTQKRYTIFWCLHYQPEGWNRKVINFKKVQTLTAVAFGQSDGKPRKDATLLSAF
jgi:hypothetical protein